MDTLKLHSHFENLLYVGRSVLTNTSSRIQRLFFIKCKNVEQRTTLINKLKAKDIHPVFHYISLHSSPYYSAKHDGRALPNTDNFTDTLLRLPLFYELDVQTVINQIIE